jgi:hypothetical protein
VRTLAYGEFGETRVKISPHTVTYLNGTTEMFFSTEEIYTQERIESNSGIHSVYAELGSEWHSHVQYLQYIVGSTRMLSTSEGKEESDKGFPFVLFVMAQLGGLLYFLRTVVGTVYGIVSKNLMILAIVNKVKKAELKEKLDKNEDSFEPLTRTKRRKYENSKEEEKRQDADMSKDYEVADQEEDLLKVRFCIFSCFLYPTK